MKRDLQNIEDVKKLVDDFYGKVMEDPIIGHFFTEVTPIDLPSHLPKLYDFWNGILFPPGTYEGNPMRKHLELNRLSEIKKEHFDHWLELFNESVDKYFDGPIAHKAKTRALSIAISIQIKIHAA